MQKSENLWVQLTAGDDLIGLEGELRLVLGDAGVEGAHRAVLRRRGGRGAGVHSGGSGGSLGGRHRETRVGGRF